MDEKTKHQEPMEKNNPDSYLSEKEKFLKKHKDDLVDRKVKDSSRR